MIVLFNDVGRLRDELRAKAREGEKLEQELVTVNALVVAKDRALKAADDKIDSLNQRTLKAEGMSGSCACHRVKACQFALGVPQHVT